MDKKYGFNRIGTLIDDNISRVCQVNRTFLSGVTLVEALVSCALTLIYALMGIDAHFYMYMAYCLICVVLYFCIRYELPKSRPLSIVPLGYTFLTLELLMAMFIDLSTGNEENSITLIVTVITAPVIMIDKPFRMGSLLTGITVIYIIGAHHYMNPASLFDSEADVVIAAVIGVLLGWYLAYVRVGFLNNLRIVQKQEKILEESDAKFSEVTHIARIAVWDYDIINKRFILPPGSAYDFALEYYELEDRVIDDVPRAFLPHCVSREDEEKLIAIYGKLTSGVEQVSDTVWFKNTPDSEPRCDLITLRTIFDDDGKPVAARCLAQDITYRMKQNQLELLEKMAEQTEDIMNSVPCGICVIYMYSDHDARRAYSNETMYRLLRYSEDEINDIMEEKSGKGAGLIEEDFLDIFQGIHPDDMNKFRTAFEDGYTETQFEVKNFRNICNDGTYIRLSGEFIYKETRNGARVYYGAYRDVTAEAGMKKLLTDQLDREIVLRKEANKANEMKTEFLSNVSHDMRTPLNAILGNTDMALKTDSAETTRDYLQKISKAGNTLLSLISDTLDLQRIENGRVHINLAPVTGESIIKTVVASVQPGMEQKNIDFNVEYDPESLVPVVTDAAKLQEVIINLMSNSTKFTREGGRIDFIITTSNVTGDRAMYSFTVRDNGVGISEEFLPKIFEPFTQERSRETAEIGGSGLGLSIVDRLVKLLGGSIGVESKLGKGTEFVVNMNMERAGDIVEDEGEAKPVRTDLKGRRVLICEDNSMNMEIAVSILSGAGLVADKAVNGKEGLEKFEASAPDYYDAILMDLRMPVMDGCTAAEKIRISDHPRGRTIPIIAMSADAYESDVKKCLEAGMNAHVSKPINADRFLEKLSKYI